METFEFSYYTGAFIQRMIGLAIFSAPTVEAAKEKFREVYGEAEIVTCFKHERKFGYTTA